MGRHDFSLLIPRSINRFAPCLFFGLALLSGCGRSSPRDAKVVTSAESAAPETNGVASPEPVDEGMSNATSVSSATVDPPLESAAGDSQQPNERQRVISQADQLTAQGRYAEAADLLKTLLIVDPQDAEITFRIAKVVAADGDLVSAIELLDGIPIDHPLAGLAAQGQAADWCLSLGRYAEAETRYRTFLQHVPNAGYALRQLAFLLNRQGRRQEAADLIRQLCLLGDVMQDELHSLIAIGDAMYSDPTAANSGEGENTSNDARRYFPISPYGDARRAFQERRYADVIELLKPSIENAVAPDAMIALFGRAAGESQDDEMLAWWMQQLTPEITRFADYWASLGMMELMAGRHDSAARALGEAMQRDPTDLVSASRMRQAMGSLGKHAEAQLWFDRWTDLRAALDANNRVAQQQTPDPASIESLATALEKLNRPLEAVLWRAMIASGDSGRERMADLNQKRKQILTAGIAFPNSSARLCGLNLDGYPLPDRSVLALKAAEAVQRQVVVNEESMVQPVFDDQSETVGLSHVYRVASEPLQRHYSIYQTLGGGVAVLDYDRDGYPDLYFAQGAADPPEFESELPNQLFRNLMPRLGEVTDSAQVSGAYYSLGVTAGDWNQDGFPDLGVAGIGEVLLFINRGDGTFAEQLLESSSGSNRVPSSIGIADVTGDQLPDVVQLGYVDDPDMTEKSPLDEQGNVLITVAPGSFTAAADTLFLNQGDGSSGVHPLTEPGDARTGLGLVVGEFDDEVGNEIFIGNDSLPNRLWKISGPRQKSDLAAVMGCAYGFSGGATGAMGIAVGDFDLNAKMDLHVTNYENENANLYLRKGKSFEDRNRQYRLSEASKDLVGFGTQAIDYDNDGDDDLIVTNGHLDDAVSIRGNFRQPMQLFRNVGTRFRRDDVSDPSGFWDRPHVGRALAKLDYNRDGKTDFVLTQIERPSALLVNQTEAGHHWIQIVLSGTRSERDAIGARIEVKLGDQTMVGWNVAGDGYLCSNEPTVSFGLGTADVIDRLKIHWPNGQTQLLSNVPVDQRLLVVESESGYFVLP